MHNMTPAQSLDSMLEISNSHERPIPLCCGVGSTPNSIKSPVSSGLRSEHKHSGLINLTILDSFVRSSEV